MKRKPDLLDRLDRSLDRKPAAVDTEKAAAAESGAAAPPASHFEAAAEAGPAQPREQPSAPVITVTAYPVHIRTEALEAVTRFSLVAAATPLIPIPVLDSVAASGVQLGMISELCRLYGQDFSKNSAQSLIGAAGAGLLSFFFSTSAAGKALKNVVAGVPVIGSIVRWGAGPVVLGGYTWFLGMAFIHHFELGGKFTEFDRKKFAAYLERVARDQLNAALWAAS